MNADLSHLPFTHRHLDPASRLGEVLFGLIMVLTATLTAGITISEGPAGVRQLLASALGCNIAWGIIDAFMFLMNRLVERSEHARFIRRLQAAPDPATALQTIRKKFEPEIENLAPPHDREALYQSILNQLPHLKPLRPHLTRDDFRGALACFWLVFLSCLPAAIPFMLLSNPTHALRISNLLLILMLFAVGQKWAQYADSSRLLAGLAMVILGLTLVGVAILLGG